MIRLPTLPQLKPRERLLALGCAAVLVVVILDRLVLNPWIQHARVIHREIQHMQEALRTHERLLSRRGRVFGELSHYQSYLKPVQTDDLEKATLVRELQELAATTSVTIVDIKALPAQTDHLARRFPIDVRFQCTLDAWVDFVYHVEASPSLYRVVRGSLATHEDEPDRLEGALRLVRMALPASDEDAPVGREGGEHGDVDGS